jgi:hypothetical protein
MSYINLHRCLLHISNLQPWISDVILYHLYPECVWIHRESDQVAYVAFNNIRSAGHAQAETHQIEMNVEDFHQDWINEDVRSNQIDTQIYVDYAPTFVEHHFAKVFQINKKQPKSRFLLVYSTARMTLPDWKQLFPTAYDIHKSVDHQKAMIEFLSAEAAKKALISTNHQSFQITIKNKLTNVFLNTNFVCETYVQTHTKKCSPRESQIIEYEEYLCNKMVEFLGI